jgi:pimeloyl-ACP methyl ester carboxylesterase
MRDFAAVVVGFADWLGIQRLDLAGHSMGGKVAMLLAAWQPARVNRLLLLDATPGISSGGLAELRRIAARPSRLFPSQSAAAWTFHLIPPETAASLPRLRTLALRSTRHRGHGRWSIGPDREFFRRIVPEIAWPALSQIRCPTLILRAQRSNILSKETARAMRRAIRGSGLVEVPNTYHHLILERPREVARAMLAFLAQEADATG